MYDWDLKVAPGPPKADLKDRILAEWLGNPFLDEDTGGLCLRLGVASAAVEEALDGLCAAGFLRRAGAGYALALDLGGTVPSLLPPADAAPVASAGTAAAAQLASQDPDPSGAVAVDAEEAAGAGEDALLALLDVDRAEDLTRQIEQTLAELRPANTLGSPGELLEALPFGVLAFTPSGACAVGNRRAADLLGLAPAQVDAATFELVTGVDPLAALDLDLPLAFSLTEPSLEITLQRRGLAAGTVALALLRDVSLLEEVSRIQADAQEELFAGLREEMVDPLVTIEGFLEAPDAAGLTAARVAMEQINWFLQDFFLRRLQAGGAGDDGEG